ncbi:MAG: GNAT family protein [Pseudomonadota bacterium]
MAQITKPELRTERLILRTAEMRDVADRLALGNSPAIQEMFGMDPGQVRPLTRAAAEAWVEAQAKEPWGWVMEHEGRCIGSIRLHQINWADKRGYLALGILDETKLGIGLGSEAMEAVVRFALGPLGLHRLTVRALAFNERAIAAYEKVGFRREGLERQSALIGSEWHDDVILGLIAPDLDRPQVSERRVSTRRLVLRPFRRGDVPRVVEILGNLEVSRWLRPIPHPFTKQECRFIDDDGCDRWPKDMAIVLDGRVVGALGTLPGLGYYLEPGEWGQGVMGEAVDAALAHVFHSQKRDAITSYAFAGNARSLRVLERAGFRKTGRGTVTSMATGEIHESVEVQLTRADWEARCSH